tara:strand:+ start:9903 stop:11747 length:1845 start_codon:yes stop_codon:yes gene_type:complete
VNGVYYRWVLIIACSLSIGSLIAFSEILFSKKIDSYLPDSSKISQFSRPGTITLLSTNGQIIQKIGPVSREKITSENMPLIIRKAFIAAEDRRFFDHNGVDFWSISRALRNNLIKRDVQEGGSTITQQLARIVFLNQDRTLARKLKEAALAYKIERQLDKEEILEQYLNNVYLGSSAYGIADAAWIYFSKETKQLTLDEIALIAGLAPAPSLYSPLINPSLAIQRRTIVLNRMYRENFISKDQLSRALNKPLELNPSTPKYFNSLAPFFSSWVLKKLPLLLTQEQLEIGGLIIRTSLNLKWQEHAKEVINQQTKENIEGAIVSIEPKTGFIRTLVGGKDFKGNEFNRATQAMRSPGSTFKIFTYAAALNKGIEPGDIFEDSQTCWNGYCPKNFDGRYLGRVSLYESFNLSINTIAVQLLDKVGFDAVIDLANSLGVGHASELGKYHSLAIGAFEETVLNMTAAYAAVTNRGVYIPPSSIEEIQGPNKKIIWPKSINNKQGIKVLEPNIADTLNWMLQGVVIDGTGKAAALQDRPVAGKTGTSEGARDVWFIGSIPQLTTSVWFGKDNNQKTANSSIKAALSWKKFMEKIIEDFQAIQFTNTSLINSRWEARQGI